MSKHERTARIESVDDSGVFRATLATEGEASDGDILSIAGGQIPDRMPMLLSHWNDPTAQAGSITEPTKELKAKPPRLRVTGQIEMGGVGPLAEIRRDVAFMMNRHGGAMSIRWDEVDGGKQPIRRVNLPSDHAYFVDADTATGAKRWGLFWPEWRAIEGSIVALGADPAATVDGRLCAARAEETDGEVSSFWRAMAQDAEGQSDDAKAAATLAALRVDAIASLDAGATIADVVNAVVSTEDNGTVIDFTPVRIGEHKILLPASIADQLEAERAEREPAPTSAEPAPEPDPAPAPEESADQRSPLELVASELPAPIDDQALRRLVDGILDGYVERSERQIKSLIDVATGKVP